MTTEHRHFTRIPFTAETSLINSRSGHKSTAGLVDISLKGVLVNKPADWQGRAGEHYTIHIPLTGSDIEINLAIIVVHVTDDQVGFKTEHMDIDAATHLHRLVELNLGDESLLEREFHELIQTK